MSKFNTKDLYNFEKYLELQKSGRVNMVSQEARDILTISKEEHHFIINNYSELLKEYNNLKVVDELLTDAKSRVEEKKAKEKVRSQKEPNKNSD